MSSSDVHSIHCPNCSASLLAGRDTLFLCGKCGDQFRLDGPWPATKTSSRAVASLALGLMSIVGLFLTGIPAFLLGVSALTSMRSRRWPEKLRGRRMAISGAALGAVCSVIAVAIPITYAFSMMQYQEQQREVRQLEGQVRGHVAEAQWNEAARVYERILKLDPDTPMHWLRCAPLYVQAGDTTGYQQLCERMLARFGETATPDVAEKIGKACMIGPTDESVLASATRLSEVAVSDPNHWAIRYSLATRGLAQYRNGEFRGAIEDCAKCLDGDEDVGRRFRAGNAFLVQAMGYAAIGQRSNAQRALGEAKKLVLSAPQTSANGWHDDLICRILLNEAEQVVSQRQ